MDAIVFFLEPVTGVVLSEYVRAQKLEGQRVSPEFVAQFMAELFGLLGCAHVQGIDHRDLSTDSICVTEDGRIQLLGLGLKAALGIDLFESIVSAAVSPLHSRDRMDSLTSFDVMSPEYQSGIEEDARVDIFGVSFVAYWLLTNEKPQLTDLKLVSSRLEGVDEAWDEFFAQGLERNREDRFQSCRGALLGLQGLGVSERTDEQSFVQRQLDRIPVPKRVVERGGGASRAYRLGVIGLVGVTLTALLASFLKDSSPRVGAVESDSVAAIQVSEIKDANFLLSVVPETARVRILNKELAFRPRQGELRLEMRPGAYQVEVSAEGFEAQLHDVVIVANGDAVQLEVGLVAGLARLKLQSEPSAQVYLVTEDGLRTGLGSTDVSGLLDVDVSAYTGLVDLIVEKAGYRSVTKSELRLEPASSVEIEVPLHPAFRSVLVQSSPAGAEVYVNGDLLGFTPYEFKQALVGERYSIRTSLEMYRDKTLELRIPEGDTKPVVADFGVLALQVGTLSYQVQFQGLSADDELVQGADLVCRLNGMQMDNETSEIERLRAGQYQLQFEHPSYQHEAQMVMIRDGEVTEVTVVMKPKSGSVVVHVPSDLQLDLRVNGKSARLDSGRLALPAGVPIDLEVRVLDHLTLKRRIELQPNERLEWTPNLRPIPGPEMEQSWKLPYLGMAMTWLAPGQYIQGSPTSEAQRLPNEGPQTKVKFTYGFWIGTHEVTQAQYKAVMGVVPSKVLGGRLPVDSVTWQQAREFCERLTEKERVASRLPEGYAYRLPTESEWEYVARAGGETAFSFGASLRAGQGNFRLGLGSAAPKGTVAVGSYEPNAWGIYDMSGNVSEWVLDGYDGRLRGAPQVDPIPKAWKAGDRVVIRGGSWRDGAERIRVAARKDMNPTNTNNSIGFRVVLAPVF